MKINISKFISTVGFSTGVALITFGNKAFAEISALSPADTDVNTDGGKDFIRNIADNALEYITLIAGILAIVYLIWNGIQYITSSGNAEKAKNARQGIINAVIGIVVIVAAYFIIRLAVGIGKTGGEVISE